MLCRKHRGGLPWEITPRRLLGLMGNSHPVVAKRAFAAMTTMVKFDIAALEAAPKGN